MLVERNPAKISVPEVLLYIWFAAFFYDELSEWSDAGSIFYATDIWNLFDITMICIGFVFAIMRKSIWPVLLSMVEEKSSYPTARYRRSVKA